jgi:hypothetical protein
MSDAPTPPASAPDPAPPAPTPRRWDWRPKLRWFAAEIVVVVAGVLIALALNAWWGGVQERELETESLREIRAALTNDLVDIKSNIRSHRRAGASAVLLREHIRAGGPYADTLDAHFGQVLGATSTIRDEAAYETLKQRGMETITNDSIRIAIGRVYGMAYPRVVSFQRTSTDLVLRDVVPFYNTRFRDLRLFGTATPVDYPTLVSSVEYAALLDWLVLAHTGQANTMERLETEVLALLEQLDEELMDR